MSSDDRLRNELSAAMSGAGAGVAAADRLCQACVDLLGVDGAAISLMHEGATFGTFGASGDLSRRLDDFQFTFGEGPCLDSVRQAQPVFAADLSDPAEQRWPVYAGAVLDSGVQAVYALPVAIARSYVGALDLYRHGPGRLVGESLAGGLLAAELAALPLLGVMTSHVDGEADDRDGEGWAELASLERVEVYQATGMIMGQLDVTAPDALIRLRAHAFANDLPILDVAWAIINRRLVLDADDPVGDSRSDPKTQ